MSQFLKSCPVGGLAALPMYDWPELVPSMNQLWTAIAVQLRGAGIRAPDCLSRELAYDAAWTRSDLVLGQTCGLPMATRLVGVAHIVGVLDLGLDQCPPGHYRSALMVRDDSPVQSLVDARGTRLVINNLDSQSGFHSVMQLLSDEPQAFFQSVVVSGAHRTSLQWLHSGKADIAAIDCHCLRLAERFGAATEGLRVIGYTHACPGTPLITSLQNDPEPIRNAVSQALATLDATVRVDLGIVGLSRVDASDYACLADATVAARAARELRAGAGG